MLLFIALSCIPPVLKVMKHFYNAFFKLIPGKLENDFEMAIKKKKIKIKKMWPRENLTPPS